MQTTLARAVEFKGVGLHSGAPARMALRPAEQRDLIGLAARAGLRAGQARGFVRYKVRREPIERRTGIGLT